MGDGLGEERQEITPCTVRRVLWALKTREQKYKSEFGNMIYDGNAISNLKFKLDEHHPYIMVQLDGRRPSTCEAGMRLQYEVGGSESPE